MIPFNKITASDYDTPFMLTDLEVIKGQCDEFSQALPQIGIYYAFKALDNDTVVQSIDQLIAGYDVASIGEITRIIGLGISPDRLLFSNPVKSPDAIQRAYAAGVRTYAFQSLAELEKLTQYAPQSRLFLRVMVPNGEGSLDFSSKFGCNPQDAPAIFKAANASGFTDIGLSFHIGSQSSDDQAWDRALGACRMIIDDVATHGMSVCAIDLGGGFPVRYDDDVLEFSTIADSLNAAIVRHNLTDMPMLAEPGRYLVADSSVIVTTIIGVEQRNDNVWLFTDVGSFHAFVEIFEFNYWPYPVYSLKHGADTTDVEMKEYTITGPSCDSYDTLTRSIMLPADLQIGDKLVIDKTGAYTTVYGSNFNGFAVPKIYFA
jgi:ornithine decarboxylase